MRTIGRMVGGETLVALDEADRAMLAAVLAYAGDKDLAVALLVGTEAGKTEIAPPPAAVAAPVATGKKPSKPSKGPRKAPKGGSKQVTHCKGCGADRKTTPWPKTGGLCRACTRKKASATYRKKQGGNAKPLKAPAKATSSFGGDVPRLKGMSFADVPGLPVGRDGRTLPVGSGS